MVIALPNPGALSLDDNPPIRLMAAVAVSRYLEPVPFVRVPASASWASAGSAPVDLAAQIDTTNGLSSGIKGYLPQSLSRRAFFVRG